MRNSIKQFSDVDVYLGIKFEFVNITSGKNFKHGYQIYAVATHGSRNQVSV